ncbi:hypothetical protein BH11PSE7_BH11PSE7_30310 [soil metagenome]
MIPSTKPATPLNPSESGKGTATDPKEGQMGEGSYEGTRDYQKSVKDYLQEADVQRDAKAARPSSAAEANELDKAEKEGRSHSHAPGK